VEGIVDREAVSPKAIFIEALVREAGREREAFLDAACAGDDALRRRVWALLLAHERADEVLGPGRRPDDAPTVALRGAAEPVSSSGPTEVDGDGAAGGPAVEAGIPLVHGASVRYFGDYEILGELGRGGMGVVYRARQVSLNRQVALKMLRSTLLAGDDERRRFRNEAEAVALLDHPGIVPVFEVGEHDGQNYLGMKLVEGASLADAPSRFRDDPRAAARLVAEAAEAVAHAHTRGILHRDLKPANILLDAEGRPHVTDFGLAKRLAGDAEQTRSGTILGTPAYMAPEQAAARRGAISTATDVYGLGAVLYSLLAGQAPFGGDSVLDVLKEVIESPPEPPRRLNPDAPRDLETICLKCLEKDPRRRYQTAQALADDLQAWLELRPIAARRVGPAERAWLWCRRRPGLAALLVALFISVLGAAAVSVAYARQQADRARTERSLRLEANQERERSDRQAYVSRINLAWRQWQDANPARCRELLEATRPARPDATDLRGFEWSYLHRLGRTPLWTTAMTGGLGIIRVKFAQDGASVAVCPMATRDGEEEIAFLDVRSGAELRRIASPGAAKATVAFAPDGRTIATYAPDGTIVLADAATGKAIRRLAAEGPRTTYRELVFSPDSRRLAAIEFSVETSTHRPSIDLWDLSEGRLIRTFTLPMLANAASLSPDGGRLATASLGLAIWDVSAGSIQRQFDGEDEFAAVAYSPDGKLLAGATDAGSIRLWDTATGARVRALAGHMGRVHRLRFSPDGRRLVSAGRDRVIRAWDVETGTLARELRGHETDIGDVEFSPDGRHLASVSVRDGVVKLWDAEQPQGYAELNLGRPSPDNPPSLGLAFSPDGNTLIAAQSAGSVRAWDTASGRPLFRLDAELRTGRSWVATAARAGVFATLDGGRSPVLRHLTTGTEVSDLEPARCGRAGALAPGGRYLAAVDERVGTIRLWDTATGRVVAMLNGHDGPVECLAFSPDGRRLASGGIDCTVRTWEVPSGRSLTVARDPAGWIAAIAFHPDGRTLASSNVRDGGSGDIRLWDVDGPGDPRVFPGQSTFIRRLSFLPDGRRLATLGDDGALMLWDVETGQEVLTIPAHWGNGIGLAVSPDGRRLATSGAEGAVRVWDSGTPPP
jgi:WD40 repeat protein